MQRRFGGFASLEEPAREENNKKQLCIVIDRNASSPPSKCHLLRAEFIAGYFTIKLTHWRILFPISWPILLSIDNKWANYEYVLIYVERRKESDLKAFPGVTKKSYISCCDSLSKNIINPLYKHFVSKPNICHYSRVDRVP